MTSRFFGSNIYLSSNDIQGISVWWLGCRAPYGFLLGEWAPKVAEKFWRIFVYECFISFATFSPLVFFFFFWGGKGCNFMDFSNLSCFMLWIWPWWGNYPDDQLIGGWTSKLSTCYCVVPENWSQGLVCPHTHTRIWRGRKTWIQKSTEYYTTNGDVVIHSSGFHLGVIFVP